MPNPVPWTERRFNFDFPVGLHGEILERLRGTPDRVDAIVAHIPTDWLTRRLESTWSIQENLGHLADLESLFAGRLDDFDSGATTLRPADMSNATTHAAGHNDVPIRTILSDLRAQRMAFVERLDALDIDGFARTAQHPRLDTPMRVVDMMLFHAEHDDAHLARIRVILRTLASQTEG